MGLGCALSCLRFSALSPPALSALLAPPCLSVALRARPSFGDLFFRARLCLPSELAAQILSTISPPPRSLSSSSFAPPEPRGSRDRKSLLWLSVGLRRALAFFVPARAMTDQRYSLRLGALVRLSSQVFSLVVSWLATCSCIFHQLLP